MLQKTLVVAALLLSTIASVPALAQMNNGMMAGHEKGMMSSDGGMKMSKSQMATMHRCSSMSKSRMMKNKMCAKMMKMHPDMMKTDSKM